jgi:hypothetical protein
LPLFRSPTGRGHCEYVSSLPLSSSLMRLNGSPFDSDFGSL